MDDGWNATWIRTKRSFKTTYNQTSVSVDRTVVVYRWENIIKSLKKCGISNALNGSEDHLIYEENNNDNVEEEEEESLDDYFQGF